MVVMTFFNIVIEESYLLHAERTELIPNDC